MKTKNSKHLLGLTVLELIVVILVLMSMLLLLFLGARAWKNFEDSASRFCLQKRSEYEEALLKYRACKDLGSGQPIDPEKVLIHAGINPAEFKCPEGNVYSFENKVPPTGTPAIRCTHQEHQKSIEAEK